ncbi:MAG: hypothetical protein ACK4FJ_06420 [Ferrovibrio sp.]|uniref:hypothetical protein n=1 Tax=Ferrovibrio sp. TaxID=1917215 RepID=UPI00391D9362
MHEISARICNGGQHRRCLGILLRVAFGRLILQEEDQAQYKEGNRQDRADAQDLHGYGNFHDACPPFQWILYCTGFYAGHQQFLNKADALQSLDVGGIFARKSLLRRAKKKTPGRGDEPGVSRKDKSAPERHRKGGVPGAGSGMAPPHATDMGSTIRLAKYRQAIICGHISVKGIGAAQETEE